jgi:bifunctional UDP-N-acetylglucosamine pyrophosphorylase/glucosamine-1-phosphate N-acetyltransferase
VQAIIMAAGKGKRLRPLTLTTPKPLLLVAGTPILGRTLAALPAAVDEVVMVVGYLGEQIRSYVGDRSHGKPVRYVQHDVIDGTAGAVRACRDVVHGRFMVVSGDDIYSAPDLAELARRPLAVLMSGEAKYASRIGLCSVNENGSLKGIVEKGSPEHDALIASGDCWVNCGAYVLDERFFDVEPVRLKSGEYGLPQTLAVLASTGVTVDVVKASFWIPIGTPEELAAADERLTRYGAQA